jgi:hypothetical protein
MISLELMHDPVVATSGQTCSDKKADTTCVRVRLGGSRNDDILRQEGTCGTHGGTAGGGQRGVATGEDHVPRFSHVENNRQCCNLVQYVAMSMSIFETGFRACCNR